MTRQTTPKTAQAGRREWLGVAVLALASAVVVMDLTVLFLALPQLTADLHPSSTELLWISDVYGFLIAGLLIAMGALGDRIGRRRVLLTGAAGFAAASLLSAFAPTAELLIAARALQGIAGATLVPSAMALVFGMFPDEVERTKALGAIMASFAAGAALGPVVGGVLLSSFWWGSVFLINVPVMVLLIVLGRRVLPEFRNPEAGRIDVASVALSIAASLSGIYGVKEIARNGFETESTLAVVTGLVIGAAFVVRQLRLTEPLIDMKLFRSSVFSTALSVNVLGAFVQYGMYLLISQYLQLGMGLSPLEAGLAGLPGIAAMMVVSGLVPKVAERIPAGYVIAGGMGITAIGFLLLTQLSSGDGLGLLIASGVVMSIGVAPAVVLGMQLIVGAVPPERAGAASGMAETANELGGALGIALLGSLGTAIYRHDVGDAAAAAPADAAEAAHDTFAGAVQAGPALPAGVLDTASDAFTHGLQVVAATNAVLMGGLALVAAIVLRKVAGQAAQHEATAPAAAEPRVSGDVAVATS